MTTTHLQQLNFDEVVDHWTTYFTQLLPEDLRRMFVPMLRELATGQPVAPQRLADLSGVPLERALAAATTADRVGQKRRAGGRGRADQHSYPAPLRDSRQHVVGLVRWRLPGVVAANATAVLVGGQLAAWLAGRVREDRLRTILVVLLVGLSLITLYRVGTLLMG